MQMCKRGYKTHNPIRMISLSCHTFPKRCVIWLILTNVIFVINLKSVECFSPLWDSVKTQVFQEYEVTEAWGQISLVRNRLKNIKTPDLTVGVNVKQNSRLILTCTAWYPSEWVYSGDADPTYISNTTIENLGPQGQVLPLDDMQGAKRYVATIVIGPRGIKQSDTGRYNCMTASPETGMKYKTLSTFYHLFVPGKSLFIRKRGGTILYDLRKSPARIPCGVTNPKVAVSLQKFQNGNLVNVDNETMLYHPISGFYPRQDIPGTYVCTAAYNKAFELLHFTLVPKSGPASSQNQKYSSEEDLEWLFNSFKLGHSNRIRLSTKRPATNKFSNENDKQSKPSKEGSNTKQTIWNSSSNKRPSSTEQDEDIDDKIISEDTASESNKRPGSTYRPVYVLFAEDLNRLKGTTERPSGSASGSGSASTSASFSEETEEEGEGEGQEGETEAEGEEEKNEGETSSSVEEKEPDHQYHFDRPPQITHHSDNPPILLQQLLATRRPVTTTTSKRPPIRQQFGTTFLPFIDFLNPGSAVVKYKPVLDPTAPLISKYSESRRTTTTPRPQASGHIVYDLQTNRLVYGSFTKGTTEKPRPTRRPSTKFKIPSLPTQRWPTTRKTKPTTRTTTTTTTPAPPLIPDTVVCINSPCGQNAKCFANTVYYHKQKETRREPACKCIENYHGNPYLECFPPSKVETDFITFNNTGLFTKRSGLNDKVATSLEIGSLQTDVFHSDDAVIVDLKKK